MNINLIIGNHPRILDIVKSKSDEVFIILVSYSQSHDNLELAHLQSLVSQANNAVLLRGGTSYMSCAPAPKDFNTLYLVDQPNNEYHIEGWKDKVERVEIVESCTEAIA